MTTLLMPIRPRPGEVILAIRLSEIKRKSHEAVLAQLQEMGYRPELRISSWRDDNGHYQLDTCALLKFETHDQPLTEAERAILDADFDLLSEAFPDEPEEEIPIVQLSIGLFPEEVAQRQDWQSEDEPPVSGIS